MQKRAITNLSQTDKLRLHLPVHSSVPLNASTVNPVGQVHVKLPGVFVQAAIGLQPPLFTVHSSISATSSQVRKSTTACTKIRLLLRMFLKFTKIVALTVFFCRGNPSQQWRLFKSALQPTSVQSSVCIPQWYVFIRRVYRPPGTATANFFVCNHVIKQNGLSVPLQNRTVDITSNIDNKIVRKTRKGGKLG